MFPVRLPPIPPRQAPEAGPLALQPAAPDAIRVEQQCDFSGVCMTADEHALLRERTRDRLRRGVLPMEAPSRSFAGPATGKVCACCDRPILAPEPEFELEFARPDALGRKTLWMHTACDAIWYSERIRIRQF
jgi:hypothetical protein